MRALIVIILDIGLFVLLFGAINQAMNNVFVSALLAFVCLVALFFIIGALLGGVARIFQGDRSDYSGSYIGRYYSFWGSPSTPPVPSPVRRQRPPRHPSRPGNSGSRAARSCLRPSEHPTYAVAPEINVLGVAAICFSGDKLTILQNKSALWPPAATGRSSHFCGT